MQLLAGYVLTFEDAKAWVQRHHPQLEISDDTLLSYSIKNHYRKQGKNLVCDTVFLNPNSPRIMFVTQYAFDPFSNWFHHPRFKETDRSKRLRDVLFPLEEDKEIYTFWTVCDPLCESLEGVEMDFPENPDKIEVASKDKTKAGPESKSKNESKTNGEFKANNESKVNDESDLLSICRLLESKSIS
ncbi:hypothetical protein H0H92_005860 [Tricholoma furcatifolium]|nr:hypothetical protein H0H92_005860 [Tricholoma furcatifolium]